MSKNFAYSTVATAPSPASSGASLVVEAGHGSRFFAGQAVVFPAGEVPSPANAEVVSVSAVNSDTLTIVRAQESSSARSIGVGDAVMQGITAGMWDALPGTYARRVALWATGNDYLVGELVINSGTLYRCTTAHTAGGSFAAGNFSSVGGGGGASVTIDADGSLVVDGTTVELGTDAEIAAAIAAAVSPKANLASPTFTGTPAAPTASAGTSTTQLATTAFVQAAVGASLFSASVSGATTVNAANGAVQTLTLTGNATFTLSGASAGAAVTLTLILKQDATGGRTVTWPGSVDWGGGSAPTLSTAGDADDIITLFTVDGGTKWFGFQQNASGGGGGGAPVFYGVEAVASSQAIATATISTIGFNGTDLYDETGNEWHSTTTNNPRLTVPTGRAGKIRFDWAITFGNSATGDRQVRIRRNGTTDLLTQNARGSASLTTTLCGYQSIYDAVVGDYFELRAYQDSGANMNVNGTFRAEWLGA